MEFIPADQVDTEAHSVGMDVAVVSVMWREGDDNPVVDYSGCSGFEAEGLLRAALKRLAKSNARCIVFLEQTLEITNEEEENDPDD